MKGLCLFISKKSWSQSSHSMWCLKELIPASFFLHVWHSMCVYSDTCPRWFVWACVTWFCLIYLFDYCCIFLSADGVVNSAFFACDSSGGWYHSSLLCMLSIWMLYFIFKKGHQINGKPSCVRLCTEQVCVCVLKHVWPVGVVTSQTVVTRSTFKGLDYICMYPCIFPSVCFVPFLFRFTSVMFDSFVYAHILCCPPLMAFATYPWIWTIFSSRVFVQMLQTVFP